MATARISTLEAQRAPATTLTRPILHEHCPRPSKQARYDLTKPQYQVGSVSSAVVHGTTEHAEISIEGSTSSVTNFTNATNVAGDNDEQREICYGMVS